MKPGAMMKVETHSDTTKSSTFVIIYQLYAKCSGYLRDLPNSNYAGRYNLDIYMILIRKPTSAPRSLGNYFLRI